MVDDMDWEGMKWYFDIPSITVLQLLKLQSFHRVYVYHLVQSFIGSLQITIKLYS